MFQHASQIQTLDNQMNKFTAPAFPEKIKTLESIPETNRESYVDLSEFSIQPNGIFPSPPKQGTGLSDMPQDRFTSPGVNHQDYVLPNINSQTGPPQTGFNYGVGYMGTQYGNVSNPNIQQAPVTAYSGGNKDNFYMQHNNNAQNMSQVQGINQLGPQTGTGFSSIPGSQQYIGSQSGYGFGSYNPINAPQTNVNENNQLGGGNVGENPSDMTDDTGDLSHMSIGNFKNAFHRNDNSYNLNLTKMDQTASRIYSQPPTPENQNVSQNFMKKNVQNMSSQPTDLLNMVNSNAFTGGNMQAGNAGQEAGKAAEKKANFKVRGDSKDLEALIAQLDPLELSQIAPLSENFLDDDDDDHGALHTKVLTKKQSKGKEEEAKIKEIENNNTTPPATAQNLPVIKEEPTQYTYNSNYNSQPPVKTDTIPTQVQLNYSTQKLIENYQSNQSATGATATTGLQIPNYGIDTNIAVNPPLGTYTTGYTVTANTPSTFSYQHQFGYSQGIPRPSETTPTQSSYSLEPKDNKGYVSPYTPYTNEKQQLSTTMSTTSYLSPSPFNYMSNPTSAQSKPVTDFQSPYQVSSMNYMSGGTPSIQIIGSSTPSSMNNLNTLNAFKPSLKASQAPTKEYHNPFAPSTSSSSNVNMQTNQSLQYQNTPTSSISQYQSAPVSRQQFNDTGYQNTSRSPVHRAEEEADEIVNKMQSLYKDWKQKNAELNQYLNELVNTAATDQTFRKTVQVYSGQRNTTLSTNDKSTLPYDFRYSVKVPSNRENFQAFMNEDFLQGVEQSDERKNNTSTKQEFKKFSNPIFDKSAFSKEDNSILRAGHQRDSSKSYFTQEEANFPQRLSANSLQTPQRTQQGYDIKKDVSPRGTYGEQNMPSVQLLKERVSEGYEFKPKFTKHHHEHDMFNSSPPKSERQYTMEHMDNRNKFNFPVNKYQAGYEHFKHTLFGFNVKKDRFIEGRNGRRINTEQMEIICMNCQEFIGVNEADRHSEMCNRFVRKMVRNIEAFVYEDVKELNNKLRNIRQRIVTKFSSLPMKKSLEMKIKQAIRCIDNAISQNNDLNQLNFLIHEGEKLIDTISNDDLTPQEMSLLVYLNRFVVIMKEKYAEIQVNTLDHAEIEELQTKRHEYEREMQRQKADMEELRERAQMMMNIQLSNKKGIYYVKTQYSKEDEVISQINSDIDSVRDDDSNDALSMVSVSLLPVDVPVMRSSADNARTEGGKIKFYSMVVNDKLLLPPSHPGKDILISDLYDECLELNLPEGQWEGFIRKKLGL